MLVKALLFLNLSLTTIEAAFYIGLASVSLLAYSHKNNLLWHFQAVARLGFLIWVYAKKLLLGCTTFNSFC